MFFCFFKEGVCVHIKPLDVKMPNLIRAMYVRFEIKMWSGRMNNLSE